MISIICSYKIVEKKETRVLLKTLDEITTISKAWDCMWFSEENENAWTVESELLDQIYHKLDKCFKYYQRKHNVDLSKIPDEYYEAKIEEICEQIRSWEE